MATNKKRVALTTEEKLYKTMRALFILHARQIDMSNREIRDILGVDRSEVNAVAKLVNKAIKRHGKSSTEGNS